MKPRLAVHKFTSCDGCQLAFLNAGEALLTLSELLDMVHFAEAGAVDIEAKVDIAFVEGSISTPDEIERIKKIRENSKYIITIGSCATAGGIQALRNIADSKDWVSNIYASPEYVKSLATSTAISQHVRVDYELWGCPVNGQQVLDAIRFLLSNATPRIKRDSECMECKRKGNVCVLVTKKQACMGPVTQTGCGSLCPSTGRGCYACYGPKENPNTQSLGHWFEQLGLTKEAIAQKFLHINNQAPPFNKAGNYFKGIKISNE
ncbi:sulfhydrogenase subunit delta [Legionella birminghamensis]|uniref:Sulfhydrogenase subunit delta n=1 Tax=Legionella birminghamensis TaxID=28083 RepID=A0A378I9P9_9GAMM|nr:sulfhydrogenase subunit delta [Legionella birminghamensis]KTC74852.1 sulfhydrogenase subunit delta [Legionella birminghamensis]STX31753.1 sulfhydrogenase subunit delta [Legionella birminghamensis]